MTPSELLSELEHRLRIAKLNTRKIAQATKHPDGSNCEDYADVYDQAIDLAISEGRAILAEQN